MGKNGNLYISKDNYFVLVDEIYPNCNVVSCKSLSNDIKYSHYVCGKKFFKLVTFQKVNEGKCLKMADIVNLAKYIIQLFYKVEGEYSCDRPKVEKLLSIAQIISVLNGNKMFDSDIVVKDCGVGIKDLEWDFLSVIKTVSPKIEPKSEPITEKINFDADYPRFYKINIKIDPDIRLLLQRVFLNFGAYDSHVLGSLFNEFKANIVTDGIIDYNKVSSFFINTKEEYMTNSIYKFIIENRQEIING